MYQTGGLFHPLLSQRIYQSNQGLKLSAKAFGLPKGVFICLKSRRLSNGSKVDMKQKQSCFLSGGGPGSRGQALLVGSPQLSTPPSLLPLVFIWLCLSVPNFQSGTSFTSGFQLTGPAKRQGPACPSRSANPHSGRWAPGNPTGRR